MIPRRTNEDLKKSIFYNGHPYTCDGTLVGQCTWYAMGRCGEVLGYPMNDWESMPNVSPNKCWNYTGVLNAKHWLNNTRWKVSNTPVVGSVMVLDGTYGHVAFVEEEIGNGIFGISQYNKNSDKKFHYEKVDLSGTTCYGMKIKGFLIVPMARIERDETKWQVQVKVNALRIRKDHSTNSAMVRLCAKGELFNVEDVYIDDYRWLKVGDGWIATKNEWVDEFPPKVINIPNADELEKQIDSLNAELREAKLVNSNLRDMNNVLDITSKELSIEKEKLAETNKMLQDKLNRIKELL